jgi:hypothetical protein
VEPPADLRELERERKQLAKAGDATGLEELAARAEQLPPSDRRDRLVYAARQNAAYARRGHPSSEGNRGFAIGAVILAVLLVGSFGALAAFADWDTSYSDYSVYNDTTQNVQVWTCADDACGLRDEEGTAEPDEAVQPTFAGEGDVILVSGEQGQVLGCITLPPRSSDYVDVTVDVSDAGDCPPGSPTSVG